MRTYYCLPLNHEQIDSEIFRNLNPANYGAHGATILHMVQLWCNGATIVQLWCTWCHDVTRNLNTFSKEV
jgi:hypothetical protein